MSGPLSNLVNRLTEYANYEDAGDSGASQLGTAENWQSFQEFKLCLEKSLRQNSHPRNKAQAIAAVIARLGSSPSQELCDSLPEAAQCLLNWAAEFDDELKIQVAGCLYRVANGGCAGDEACFRAVLDTLPLQPHLEKYLQFVHRSKGDRVPLEQLERALCLAYATEQNSKEMARMQAILLCMELALDENKAGDVYTLARAGLSQFTDREAHWQFRLSLLEALERIEARTETHPLVRLGSLRLRILHSSDGEKLFDEILQVLADPRLSLKGDQCQAVFRLFLDHCPFPVKSQSAFVLLVQQADKPVFRWECLSYLWKLIQQAPVNMVHRYLDLVNAIGSEDGRALNLFEEQLPRFLARLEDEELDVDPKVLSDLITAIKPGYHFWKGGQPDSKGLIDIRDHGLRILRRKFDVVMPKLVQDSSYKPGRYLEYGCILAELAVDAFCRDDQDEARSVSKKILLNTLDAAVFELREIRKRDPLMRKGHLRDILSQVMASLNQLELSCTEEQLAQRHWEQLQELLA